MSDEELKGNILFLWHKNSFLFEKRSFLFSAHFQQALRKQNKIHLSIISLYLVRNLLNIAETNLTLYDRLLKSLRKHYNNIYEI